MKTTLQLAQHFYAFITLESIPLKKLVELAQLMDRKNTVKRFEAPVKLTTEPVMYRAANGQCEVLNFQQVMMGADTISIHPETRILVSRLNEETDLPMARLFFQVLELARFGEIDPLIHSAYANNHDTALLSQNILKQRPDQPITTRQLERLCGGRVRKSTINNRKKSLGYTQPGRGCKARHVNSETPITTLQLKEST